MTTSHPGREPESRILILEDEPMDAELAQRLLSRAGLAFRAVVVDTLPDYTDQLGAFGPDLVLSDFSLPGFTGADALEIAKERCPQVPFIVWSGALGDEAAVDLIKHGATDYVLKDRPARLPSAVSRALAEARQRARLAELESQLGQAQHLASLGHLGAAEQIVLRMREVLASERGAPGPQQAAGPGGSPPAAPRPDAAGAPPGTDEGPV